MRNLLILWSLTIAWLSLCHGWPLATIAWCLATLALVFTAPTYSTEDDR